MLVNVEIPDEFKHLIAPFRTTDIGSTWHKAFLPRAIIPYFTQR